MWINILAFNLSWLGLILIGNAFVPVVLLWLMVHLAMVDNKAFEASSLILIATIGITLDSCLSQLGIFVFPQGYDVFGLPFWLLCLWLAFAATLRHSFAFLAKSRLLQLLAGLLAPVSYFSGAELGAVSFTLTGIPLYLLLATLWSVQFLLFYYLLALLAVFYPSCYWQEHRHESQSLAKLASRGEHE